MTITLAGSFSESASGADRTILDGTDIPNTSGNLQVLKWGHRSSTRTPEITDTSGGGDGDWQGPYLVETEIGDTYERRAMAWAWRTVPSDAGNIVVGWDADEDVAVNIYEFASDTGGGSWQLDSSTSAATFANDSATTSVSSLIAQAEVDPGAEGVVVYGVVTRHGAPESEDSYDESFTTGVGAATGPGSFNVAVFSGYRITGTAVTPTASWSTAARATSTIAAFSYAVTASGNPIGPRSGYLRGAGDYLRAVAGAAPTDVPVVARLPVALGERSAASIAATVAGRLGVAVGARDLVSTDRPGVVARIGAGIGQRVAVTTSADTPITARLPVVIGSRVSVSSTRPAVVGRLGVAVGERSTIGAGLPAVGRLPVALGERSVVTPAHPFPSRLGIALGARGVVSGARAAIARLGFGLGERTSVTIDGTVAISARLPVALGSRAVTSTSRAGAVVRLPVALGTRVTTGPGLSGSGRLPVAVGLRTLTLTSRSTVGRLPVGVGRRVIVNPGRTGYTVRMGVAIGWRVTADGLIGEPPFLIGVGPPVRSVTTGAPRRSVEISGVPT